MKNIPPQVNCQRKVDLIAKFCITELVLSWQTLYHGIHTEQGMMAATMNSDKHLLIVFHYLQAQSHGPQHTSLCTTPLCFVNLTSLSF